MKGELPVHTAPSPNKPRRLVWPIVCLALFGLTQLPLFPSQEVDRNPAYLIKARHGAVASENKRCSDIGVDVLKEGGNAVDATVSTILCLGVVNMFSSGIGGGGFMTVRVPSSNGNRSQSEVYTIDFRETAPALSNTTMFSNDPMSSRFGGLSVAVPGELRGLSEAHRLWGSLPWKRLVQPAADLAAGWTVDREMGVRLKWFGRLIVDHPDFAPLFAPNGRVLETGELVQCTNLSRTLATIANEGVDAFYKGPIADSIVAKVRSAGGILTNDDLEGYTVRVQRAIEGSYRGRRVYTTDAPTSGRVLLHMLNLVEKYDLDKRDVLSLHRVVEAMKFGFAARTRISDLGYNNNSQLIEEITTKKFTDAVYANITDDRTHPPEYYNAIFDRKDNHGTTHASIVDKDGMAVAITSTINLVYGSQVLDPITGVLLNDEMDDFSTPGFPNSFGLWPSPFNYPEGGKRALSSTVPSILEHEDGSFYMAIGGSGGSRIFGSVFQVLLNMDWGMNPSEAIEAPRFHDQLYPTVLEADWNYPPHILDGLRERGHNVKVLDISRITSEVQVVTQSNDIILAASDSRKNGIASGY